MPLGTRHLKVILKMPGGDVVLDQTLDLRVQIRKKALDAQSTCMIEITNLNTNLREFLLSQFTAFNKRQVKSNTAGSNNPYVNVEIEAGYVEGNLSRTGVIFFGQVVMVNPTSYPPNLTLRIECYTRQLDKLKWMSDVPPEDVTFLEYVQWVGRQLDLNVICDTKMNNSRNWNSSSSTQVLSQLVIDIQNAYRPDIAAYVEDNFLIVRDIDKVVSSANRVNVTEFVGTPVWNEWGVEFMTLFDPRLTLTSAVSLNSLMNPKLNQDFVIFSVDHDLSARDNPFYTKVYGIPPAP